MMLDLDPFHSTTCFPPLMYDCIQRMAGGEKPRETSSAESASTLIVSKAADRSYAAMPKHGVDFEPVSFSHDECAEIIAVAVDLNFLGMMDKLVGTVLLMLGGFLTSILVGYKIRDRAEAELMVGLDNPKLVNAWMGFVRYLVPPVLLVVLAFSLPALWSSIQALFS